MSSNYDIENPERYSTNIRRIKGESKAEKVIVILESCPSAISYGKIFPWQLLSHEPIQCREEFSKTRSSKSFSQGMGLGLLERVLGISKTKSLGDPGCWKYSKGKVRSSGHVRQSFVSPVGQYAWKGGGFRKGFWSFAAWTDNIMPLETGVTLQAGGLTPLLALGHFAVAVCSYRPLTIPAL